MDNLRNALFGNAEFFGQINYLFAVVITGADFRVSFRFSGQIVLRRFRKWRIIQQLDDMKRGEPSVEASRVFEAPMGHTPYLPERTTTQSMFCGC